MANWLTVIPFDATGKVPQRQRELLDAKARSHVAAVNHRRAKVQRHSARERTSQITNLPDDDGIETDTDIVETVRWRQGASNGLMSTILPHPQVSELSTRYPRRTIFWNFGSLGSACRVESFDAAAIQFFGDWNIGASPDTVAPMSAFVVETVQRAVHHGSLLPSLVSAVAFEMARFITDDGNIMINKRLKKLGLERNVKALYQLRQTLSTPDDNSDKGKISRLAKFSSVAHLCMGAMRAGDRAAANAHLGFLLAFLDGVFPTEMYTFVLESSVVGSDVRAALENGTRPLVSEFEPGKGVLRAEIETRSDLVRLSTLRETWRDHESSYHVDVLRGRLDNFFDDNSGAGFWWAVTDAGLILPTLLDTIRAYRRNYATLGTKVWPSPAHPLQSLGNVHALVLFKLCQEYDRIRGYYERSVKSEDISRESDPAYDITHLSLVVVVALQIKWVASFHMLPMRQTLPVLSRRLRNLIETGFADETKARRLMDGKEVLRRQLRLWVLVAGISGVGKENIADLDWFRARALDTVRALRSGSSKEVCRMLRPFCMHKDDLSRTYEFLANALVNVNDAP